MIVRDAIKRCPQLVCLPYTFDEYRNIAKTVYTIVARSVRVVEYYLAVADAEVGWGGRGVRFSTDLGARTQNRVIVILLIEKLLLLLKIVSSLNFQK